MGKKIPSNFQERSLLLFHLCKQINNQKGTQAEKAERLGITQPRLNDLLKNKVENFSVDALITIAKKAGLKVNLRFR